MIFEEPTVEFSALDTIDIATVSGLTGGVDSCNGPTSYQRNCKYAGLAMMDLCGYYDQETRDQHYTQEG